MQSPKQLSLKSVTLYTSPLAFFQREAEADGGNDYTLEIPMKEQDLVVDTLSLTPPPDTTSVSINFDSKDTSNLTSNPVPGDTPSDTNLFPFHFGVLKSQGDILSSLIGSRLELTTTDGAITECLLMSIEKKKEQLRHDSPVIEFYSQISILNSATCTVSSIPLSSLKSFRIIDQYLQEQLMASS